MKKLEKALSKAEIVTYDCDQKLKDNLCCGDYWDCEDCVLENKELHLEQIMHQKQACLPWCGGREGVKLSGNESCEECSAVIFEEFFYTKLQLAVKNAKRKRGEENENQIKQEENDRVGCTIAL